MEMVLAMLWNTRARVVRVKSENRHNVCSFINSESIYSLVAVVASFV
jgi:hypothetical protein